MTPVKPPEDVMRKSVAVMLALFACAAQAQSHELVKKWASEATLKVPESVCIDAKRKVLYVSNIDGEPWGDDKKGSVAKLTLDGKIIAVDWVTGLSAPKGLALYGNSLYAGDMSDVVVIDVDKGVITKRIPMPGATGLNDVAAGPDGVIYVSDSQQKKLFAIRNGKPEVLVENLKAPNGVVVHRGSLYLLDGDGAYRIEKDRSLKQISGGMEGVLDGIEPANDTDFLVSTWQGTVMYIKADGSRETLLDTRADKINAADIGYDVKTHTLYVPTFFKNGVVAYELK